MLMAMGSATKEILFLSLLAFHHFLIKSTNCLVEENRVRCDRLIPDTKDNKLTQRSSKETIYFGLMLSFPDPQGRPSFTSSFDDGHDIAPAVYLAVKQVNNRTDLLKEYDIEILRLDGGCDVRGRTVIGVNELVCSRKSIVGIIGPSCERSSKTVSQLTNREDFSMITINYGGQHAATENYSYAFGILGSRSMYSMAFTDLIKHNNWTNYALLYSGSDLEYSTLGRELINLTSLIGFPPRFTSAIYDDFIPLRTVKGSFSRVVIIIDSPPVILRTLCLAYHEGIVFPSYQWVFQGTVSQDFSNTSFTYQGRVYTCSESQIKASVNGSINLFLNALQDHRDEDTDQVEAGYHDGYELETRAYSMEFRVPSKTSVWAKGFYDAVWALAYALNSSLVDLNISLTDYELGSPVLAESIKSHMFDLEFRGITGTIKFDNITGFNEEGFLNVLQYKENKSYIKIGHYKDRQLKLFISSSSVFIDSQFKEQFIYSINVRVVAGIFTITAVTFILLISAQIVNIRCRNHRAIKASSPNLNHLIFVGGYMIVIGIVLYTVENFKQINATAQLHLCNFIPLLFSAGVTLFLGTSCTKTWRLNRIYVHSKRCNKENIKSIKGYVLVGFVCTLVAVDLLVYILWFVIDPFMLNVEVKVEVGDEPVMIVHNVCHSTYEGYWIVALVVPKVMLIFASFLLAISTQINIKEFKTSNVIIFTFCLTVIFGLGIPLYAIIHFENVSVSTAVGVLSTSLNLSIWICIIILILPLIKSRCTNTNMYQIIGYTK